MPTLLRGIPAAPGVVVGKCFMLASERFTVPKREIPESQVPEELVRFERALAKTNDEIVQSRHRVSEILDEEHARILDVHLLVLEDVKLIQETMAMIKGEKVNVEYAFSQVLEDVATAITTVDDEYLRERASDIRDVGRRVLRNLLGRARRDLSQLEDEVVVVAYDLSPSDTAMMHHERVTGFATDIGARTSHTAIMAKALEIPAVVGLAQVTQVARRGGTIIVDGTEGLVIVDPDAGQIAEYESRHKRLVARERELTKIRKLPTVTLDGHKVALAANIELPEELPSVISHGCEGVGLYRTEFFYLNRLSPPTEDEQYEAYASVARQVAPHSAIIRTLDLGGDKFATHFQMPKEMNPFMGWRGIRFCLERPDIFKAQLRAILRASAHGRLRIMFPLISTLQEIRAAKAVLEEAKSELIERGQKFDEGVEVGVMVETPAAAVAADFFAREVDFFSIGTNDLIQYSLAIDRINEKIAHLYDPAHPAVLRLVKNVVDAGHAEGIWVGMCGEMAGETGMVLCLLGLGLDELSMSPVTVPKMKRLIRNLTLADAEAVTDEVLELPTGDEVTARLSERMRELAADLLE